MALNFSRSMKGRTSVHRGTSRQAVVVVRAAKTPKGPSIAVVGVTGAVGQEFLTVSFGVSPGSDLAATFSDDPARACRF